LLIKLLLLNDKSNVIVVSIPDYAFTPFGQASGNPAAISSQIDRYNEYAKNYCEANSISFIFITDITRRGSNKSLVASDGLHPSELAYSLFVEEQYRQQYCNSQLKTLPLRNLKIP
jgi:lysophospholipase L1-like esterase